MKTKESIQSKWERKEKEMRVKADFKYSILLKNWRAKYDKDYEKMVIKVEKKKQAYINKKVLEYKRKMQNEIRELK